MKRVKSKPGTIILVSRLTFVCIEIISLVTGTMLPPYDRVGTFVNMVGERNFYIWKEEI